MRAILFFVLFCATANAQVATVPPYYASTFGGLAPGSYTGVDCCGEDPSGKTACAFTRDANTFVILQSGQSLNGNNVSGALAPMPNVCNYNPYDGRLYADGVRLLGPLADAPGGVCVNGDGSQCRDNLSRYVAADILSGRIPNSFTKVIVISVPIGGSQASFWATGAYAPHMASIIANLVSHGMTPNVVLWGEGESANQAGVSQADEYNALAAIISNARISGLPSAVPWLVALETLIEVGGVPTGSAAIRDAQLQIVDPTNHVFNGPDYDVNIPYNSACRLLPAPHLTGASVVCGGGITGGGAGWAALLWGNKMHNAGLY